MTIHAGRVILLKDARNGRVTIPSHIGRVAVPGDQISGRRGRRPSLLFTDATRSL
ncbi:MAG: hypothetical protein WBH86_00015 [Thermogutta sp.]|nr:hypothetical protein [Thermogutta sp.]HPZ83669.1 hypothetical protein [Thermogutta sp.]HQF13291.1 hypothetical protein [Thermogutta sp.]